MTSPPQRDLLAYLTAVSVSEPRTLIEVRFARQRGMGQRFFDSRGPADAASFILSAGQRTDVYVGVAPRARHAGGKAAIEHSHVVWAELDQRDAAKRLSQLALPASMIVSSGSPGHLHAYWRLDHPLPPREVQQLNERLALALDGDRRCVDVARILRPPQTKNHKHTPPAAVELVQHTSMRYSACELDSTLPRLQRAPHSPIAQTALRSTLAGDRHEVDVALRAIPARDYITALTGRTPDRAGKVRCPFHDDAVPSLQVYTHDWYCYGCGRGGSIYDFAAHLWHTRPRGREFVALRHRLADELAKSTRSVGHERPATTSTGATRERVRAVRTSAAPASHTADPDIGIDP